MSEYSISWSWCRDNCDEFTRLVDEDQAATWLLPSCMGWEIRLVIWNDMSGGIWYRCPSHKGNAWEALPTSFHFKSVEQLDDLLRALKGLSTFLFRDAREAETPCPDCVILGDSCDAVIVGGKIFLEQQDGRDTRVSTYHECRTISDLRKWCEALKFDMPKVECGT